MIGLLVITHGQLAKELLEAAEFIVGAIDTVAYVAIDASKDSKKLRDIIQKKMKALDQGQGVLVLADMFGGTPSNLALSFLQKDSVEVVTGTNLPMVIAVAHSREGQTLSEVADIAKTAGRRSISLASELLKPTKEKESRQ